MIYRTDSLSRVVKSNNQEVRWSNQDTFILVHKYVGSSKKLSLPDEPNRVASLGVDDDSEIDWKLLADPDWNLWSAHQLQRRWQSLKKGIQDADQKPFSGLSLCLPYPRNQCLLTPCVEILEILTAKQGSLPDLIDGKGDKRPGKRRHLSKAILSEEDIATDIPEGVVTALVNSLLATTNSDAQDQ